MSDRFQLIARFWARKRYRRLLITLMIVTLLLGLLPLALEYATVSLLKKAGATSAQVENIDLNLFSGQFKLENLTFQVEPYTPARLQSLSFNVGMLRLLQKQVYLQTARIQGLQLDIEQQGQLLVINGLSIPTDSSAQKDKSQAKGLPQSVPGIRIEQFELTESSLRYLQSRLDKTLAIDRLTLLHLDSSKPEQAADLALQASIDQARLSLDAALRVFSAERSATGKLALQSLRLQDFSSLNPAELQQLQGTLDLSSEYRFRLAASGQPALKADTALEIRDLQAQYKNLQQNIANVQWQGLVELQESQPRVQGDLHIRDSETRDHEQNFRLLAFSQLALSQLEYGRRQLSVHQAQLDGLLGLEPDNQTPLIQADAIRLNQLQLPDAGAIEIQTVDISKPEANIALTSQGKLRTLAELEKTLDALLPKTKLSGEPASPPAQADATSSDREINIGQLRLQQTGVVDFVDNSVTPLYRTRLLLEQFDVESINPNRLATFQLKLQQGAYSKIQLEGSGLLFRPTDDLTIHSQVSRLDLPPVTPYISRAAGYGLKTGTLDAEISASLKQRKIDALMKVTLDSVEVIETDPKTAEKMASAAGMSIDLALSTLKDDQDEIKLEVPVKGDLEQPDFDISDIINTALGKAMRVSSLAYLKHALQPFGSLVTLVSLAKAAANHISLPAVKFTANSAEIDDDQQALLEKVGRLMKERPKLKLKVCGISAAADKQAIQAAMKQQLLQKLRAQQQIEKDSGGSEKTTTVEVDPQAVQQALIELADKRAAKIKNVLVSQHGVAPERLLNCLSEIDLAEDRQPVVTLTL